MARSKVSIMVVYFALLVSKVAYEVPNLILRFFLYYLLLEYILNE